MVVIRSGPRHRRADGVGGLPADSPDYRLLATFASARWRITGTTGLPMKPRGLQRSTAQGKLTFWEEEHGIDV
jgi:hypothetical protein